MTTKPSALCFIQFNTNKSNTSQSPLLHSIADYDLVFLQEPHIDFLKNTHTSQQWRVIYPPNHKDSPHCTHSITLVNMCIATNGWSAIRVDDPDITTISLEYDTGIMHIYNPHDSQCTLTTLANATQAITGLCDPHLNKAQVIWLGDFNQHHPIWKDEHNIHLLTNACMDN